MLDHGLVGSFVHDKYKSVVVLNGLDGSLAGEWVLDDSELVEGVKSLDRFNSNLWGSLLDLAHWSSEGGSAPHLRFLSYMSTFLDSG